MELRGYFFGNMYLSSIQQGIQQGHCLGRMAAKYRVWEGEGSPDKFLFDWLEKYETVVLLNAGYSDEIRNLLLFFNDPQNPYPFGHFRESREALDGALTCAGIVLPHHIYTGAWMVRNARLHPWRVDDFLDEVRETGTITVWDDPKTMQTSRNYNLSKWEYDMMLRLNNYGMAS